MLGILRVAPKQIGEIHSRYLEGDQKLRMVWSNVCRILIYPELEFLMFPFQCSGARTGRQAEPITAGTPGEDGSRRWEQQGMFYRLYVCISGLVYANSFCSLCRSSEDRCRALRGEEDPEWDARSSGAERFSCGSPWGATASRKRGRQGPGGSHAFQRL